MRIAIFIITTVKSIVIGLLPILMIHTMGDENYSESFYLSIYIMKCIFSLIARLGNKRRSQDIVAFIRQRRVNQQSTQLQLGIFGV